MSELIHNLRGKRDTHDLKCEAERTRQKTVEILRNGLVLGDMGTRRRFSFGHHDMVLRVMKEIHDQGDYDDEDRRHRWSDRFAGTSNIYLAMKRHLTPIGTMSHQLI